MDWRNASSLFNTNGKRDAFAVGDSSSDRSLKSAFGAGSLFARLKPPPGDDARGTPISPISMASASSPIQIELGPGEESPSTAWGGQAKLFGLPHGLSSNGGYRATFAPFASDVHPSLSRAPGSTRTNTSSFAQTAASTSAQSAPNDFSLFGPQSQIMQPEPATVSETLSALPSATTIPPSSAVPSFFSSASANSWSSFNKPAGGGGLFGSTTSTTAPATTGFGSFGQQQQQPQQQQQAAGSTGGLFGSFGQQNQNNAASTNNATSGGLFGQQKPATGGLFGQQSTSTPATGGLFGQQTQQSASQPAAGGLFGAASQAKPAGGLFGSTTQQPAQSGGLFGQQQQQQQQPAQSGGLFGSTTQQQAQSGGLFGSTTQQKPAGGLFGSTTQQPAQSGGLFGQQQQQQQPAQSGGLFGSTTQQPAQSGGLFGNKPAGGVLSTSTFQQPAAQLGVSKTTKFSDLPEGAQKVIEQMDAFFKDQRHVGQTIDAEPIGRAIWQTTADIKVAHNEAAAIAQGLEALKHSLERLAAKVQRQTQDVQTLLETWEAAKPADARHPGVRPVAHRDFPQAFFARVAAEEAERVARYKRNIQLLSRAVVSLGADTESMTPQVVVQTIQNNQAAILALAAQLEGLEMRMNTLRANFTWVQLLVSDPELTSQRRVQGTHQLDARPVPGRARGEGAAAADGLVGRRCSVDFLDWTCTLCNSSLALRAGASRVSSQCMHAV